MTIAQGNWKAMTLADLILINSVMQSLKFSYKQRGKWLVCYFVGDKLNTVHCNDDFTLPELTKGEALYLQQSFSRLKPIVDLGDNVTTFVTVGRDNESLQVVHEHRLGVMYSLNEVTLKEGYDHYQLLVDQVVMTEDELTLQTARELLAEQETGAKTYWRAQQLRQLLKQRPELKGSEFTEEQLNWWVECYYKGGDLMFIKGLHLGGKRSLTYHSTQRAAHLECIDNPVLAVPDNPPALLIYTDGLQLLCKVTPVGSPVAEFTMKINKGLYKG